MIGIKLTPQKQAEVGGHVQRVSDEEVMALLARAGATHRLSVSPESDRTRLQAIVDGRFALDNGERIAVLSTSSPPSSGHSLRAG